MQRFISRNPMSKVPGQTTGRVRYSGSSWTKILHVRHCPLYRLPQSSVLGARRTYELRRFSECGALPTRKFAYIPLHIYSRWASVCSSLKALCHCFAICFAILAYQSRTWGSIREWLECTSEGRRYGVQDRPDLRCHWLWAIDRFP